MQSRGFQAVAVMAAALAAGAALAADGGAAKPATPSPKGSKPASEATPPKMAPNAPHPEEKALRERIEAYWKTREATNLHAAYPFYEESFRKQYTADAFARDFRRLNRFAPDFIGVDSIAYDATGDLATVKVTLRTRPEVLGGQELVSVTEEKWVRAGGQWWKAAEPLLPSI